MNLKWRKWQSKLLIISTIGVMIWIVFVNNQIQANADWFGLFDKTNDEAKEILLLYDHYLVQGNVILFILRWIGWLLIIILERGVTIFSTANLDILELGNFASSKGFGSIMDKLDSLQYFLLLMAMILLFFMMLMGKKVEFSQAMGNLMICMIIVMVLPIFVSTMLGLATDIGKGLAKGDNDLNIGQKTVIDNTADLTVFAENKWIDSEKIDPKNQLTNIKYVRITQQITKPEEFGGNGVLGYNLDNVDGQDVAAKFDPDVGFGKRWAQDLIGEGYYRWHVNFITTIVILAALNVAYILSGIRMGRLMIELAFNQGFATYLAFADFRTMTRLKQVLFNIVGTICVIVAVFSIFSVFSAFATFIVNSHLTGVSYALALIGAIWFVIDGPTMIQKVLGVDAGMSSAWGVVGGAVGIKAMAGAGKITTAAAGMAAKGAAYAGGAIAGTFSNISDGLADGLNKKKDDSNMEEKDDAEDNGQGLNASNENTDDPNSSDNQGNTSEENDNELLENPNNNNNIENDDPSISDDGTNDEANSLSEEENQNTPTDEAEDIQKKAEGLNASKEIEKEKQDGGENQDKPLLSNKNTAEDNKPPADTGVQTINHDESIGDGEEPTSNNHTVSQPAGSITEKPTLSNQLKNKVKDSSLGRSAQAGYKLTRKTNPKEQKEDE
ncbi:hypothetical protein D8X92_13665 [Listeria ivanovii]|uniref:DUF8208 domain-containing protein n=1 Tax=Listeria ivanovii subsp. londoniensis TaxID=202752 RepID=A0ABS1G861_LISIV|nr:hypothetical protein [Listeria ivanovii]MBK1962935.1 hypothetical protein [Listeria ivanovii subsp. londoniensis]MBM5721737.1 hypothetical protein [Listeria ivanovii]